MREATNAATPVSVGAPWAPGQNIGGYMLLARMAVGGMAEIWLARQLGLKGFERIVVIKKMSEALTADPSFVEMFLDEARIVAQLQHPNIVQIYELGEFQGAYFIAMEYLAGEDLSSLVRASLKAQRPMPLSYAVRIIADAAAGLASAHAKTGLDGKPLNIVHRDVSPQNLIVTYEGTVKVLDFGIAKAANRSSTTATGQLKGKCSYMAPEQVKGEDLDARVDVWALGVVLFETVTRSRLFPSKDDHARTAQAVVSSEPLPSASSRNAEVPSQLDAIIACALSRDAAHRYPSALAFQIALEEWLKGRTDAPMGQALAGFMRDLFAARMAERTALIDSLRAGKSLPSGDFQRIRPPTERSMPGGSSPRAFLRRRPWVGLLALVLVAAGVVAGVALSRPEPGTIVIETMPDGAQVLVDDVPVGTAPLTLVEQPAGDHVVVATLEGYPSQRRTLRLASGGHSQTQIAFPPPPVKVVAVVPVAPPDPVEPKVVKTQPLPLARGTLTFETEPWTRVFENGRVLGETPLISISLTAGRHRFRLVNEEKKIDRSVEVLVAPNKATVKRLKF